MAEEVVERPGTEKKDLKDPKNTMVKRHDD